MYDRTTSIRDIVTAFPESGTMKAPGSVWRTLLALTSWGGQFEQQGEEAAAAYLLGRVRAYAGSPKLRGIAVQFRPSMAKWMDEQMYLVEDRDLGIRPPAPPRPVPKVNHDDEFRRYAAENWKRRHGGIAKGEGEGVQ